MKPHLATKQDVQPFRRITAGELATGRFDLTYLNDGVLVKDQPAGLVALKKSLKTNVGVDLAISLSTGGRFLGYFRVAEPKRPAMFSGQSGISCASALFASGNCGHSFSRCARGLWNPDRQRCEAF